VTGTGVGGLIWWMMKMPRRIEDFELALPPHQIRTAITDLNGA